MAAVTGFLDELKRRRVVRAVVVYLAAAFAALQGADVLVPALHLPAWIVTAVAVLAIIGLPVVIGLSWAFDLGGAPAADPRPDPGAGPAPGAGPGAGPSPSRSPRWLAPRTVVAAGLFLAVGLTAGWWVARPTEADAASVAVLPFDDFGAGGDAQELAMGLHDDVLSQLARVQALRVTSRTSVLAYRGTQKNVREIAGELGVGTLLEGGVRRAGDQIRVNMELIDARADRQLWSQTFDRTLTAANVFAIQSEIAREVATALRARLSDADRKQLAAPAPPTENLQALQAYYAGRDRFYGGTDGRDAAAEPFRRATELDPAFARAWAGLAGALSWQVRTGLTGDTTPARGALDRARALAPNAVETRIAEGFYQYYARADYRRAIEVFEAIHREHPGDAAVLDGLASVQRRAGRSLDAAAGFAEEARLDPLNPSPPLELGWTLMRERRFAGADSALARSLRLAADGPTSSVTFGNRLWGLADTAGARRVLAAMPPGPWVALARSDLALVHRDWPAALAALGDLPPGTGLNGDSLAAAVDPGDYVADYEVYFTTMPTLRLARVAWLSGDAEGQERHAAAAMAATAHMLDDLPRDPAGRVYDPWGMEAMVHTLRAVAAAFEGDVAGLRPRSRPGFDAQSDRDAADGAAILDQLATASIVLGRKQQALDYLERLMGVPSTMSSSRMRLDPTYDSLRGEPRFRALLGN